MAKHQKLKSILGILLGALLIFWATESGFLADSNNGQEDVLTQQHKQSASHKEDSDVVEGQTYSSPKQVAAYLHYYNQLPENYITKEEAKAAGWIPEDGNLWEVTDKKSIGGDHFGNYEESLPAEDDYKEADVNYNGGHRGPERLVYSDDGDIYYSPDHYDSFEQLYEGE